MDRNFQRALPLVLKHEGGFVDHPDDPGGATNKGVTLATFRRYVKANGTVDDLRNISGEQVATVYYRHYWSAVSAAGLPAGVDYAVFDFAVNSGPSRAAKFLQGVLGVTIDGRIGPQTLAAAKAASASDIVTKLCTARLAWLKRLDHWETFGRGWTRRVTDVKRDALAMVGNPADVERIPVPVPRPTVPDTVETEVKKKTTLWGWITSLISGGGMGAAGLLGANWQTIAVIFGGLVAVLLIGLLLRNQIIGAVRDIRRAVEGEA